MIEKDDNRVQSISKLEIDKWKDIRTNVRSLCKKVPGEYWRKLDQTREYPEEFVKNLTD